MILWIVLIAVSAAMAQTPEAGRSGFEANCVACHGGDGAGGEHGPAIVRRIGALSDSDIARTVVEGLPHQGMPAFKLTEREMDELIAFLRILKPGPGHGLSSKAIET